MRARNKRAKKGRSNEKRDRNSTLSIPLTQRTDSDLHAEGQRIQGSLSLPIIDLHRMNIPKMKYKEDRSSQHSW